MNEKPLTPRPGSDDAIAMGCTCPVLDNARGRGAFGTSGPNALFWYAQGCPLHDYAEGVKQWSDHTSSADGAERE